MPITFINGFMVPKYRRYGEFLSDEGSPEGGSQVGTPTDYTEIPYAMGYYHSNSLRLMNTGFQRNRYQMKTAATVTKAVISFHLKFYESTSANTMGESCFFVLRSGYSEGTVTNTGRGSRVCELCCNKDPDEITKGTLEVWVGGDSDDQSNFSGSLYGSSASKAIQTNQWYFCEVVFNAGAVSVYLDGALVVSCTVPASGFDSHGIEWESFGFRGVMVSDYVFQEGSDAERLITPVRITNLFPARDKITDGISTGANHYDQINDARVLNASSYVTIESGEQELFGMERGYPLGAPMAISANVILSGSASGMKALYRNGDAGALLDGVAFADTFGRSTSGSGLQDLFYAGALNVRDPNGDIWDDSDWVASWQPGFEGGSAKVHQFVIERLHINGAGSGARYRSF